MIKDLTASYDLRYLSNTMTNGGSNNITVPFMIETPLEKSGRVMRNVLKSVQYYTQSYPYYPISSESLPHLNEKKIKGKFSTGNDFGR